MEGEHGAFAVLTVRRTTTRQTPARTEVVTEHVTVTGTFGTGPRSKIYADLLAPRPGRW